MKKLPKEMESPTISGRHIMNGPFSDALKNHLSALRADFQTFDKAGTPVMPYIAAWQADDNTIWYEYVSRGLLALLDCAPDQAAAVFSNSVLERHVYKEIDPDAQVDEDVLHKEALLDARPQLRNEVTSRGAVEAVYKVQGADGKVIWLKDQATIQRFEKDGVYLSPGVMTVVTKEMEAEAARKRMEKILLKSKEKFWYQATHDDLTGLYNTRYLYRMLEQLLEAAKNLQRPLSLLFFDIDNFKRVVDTHGHLNASRVIREIGATDQLTRTLSNLSSSQELVTASGLIGRNVTGLADDSSNVDGVVDRITVETSDENQRSVKVHVGQKTMDIKNIREIQTG